MNLAQIPADIQTRLAGIWLSGEAKMWYINTYKDVKPLPSLEKFIEVFKEYHQVINGEADIITRVETMHQDSRTINQFCNEFKMLIAQLGPKTDLHWIHVHFFRGVDKNVRCAMIPFINGDEKLDELIKKACNIAAHNNEFGKSLDRQSQAQKLRYSTPCPMGNASSISAKSASGKINKFITKLNDNDRNYLRRNSGCFNCRKINVKYISTSCPDLLEAEKANEVKKESISALGAIVESDSDSEYSHSSVPTIKLATIIENTVMPSSLADSGATINLISSDKVEKYAISTHPAPPVRIHEPMNSQGVLVHQKVVSKIRIPEEDWESIKSAELLVASLRDHDVILGMSFLASENILIDPAHGKVILPANEGHREDDVAEGHHEDVEDDVAEVRHEDVEDFDWNYYPAMLSSICPKMPALPKIIPPDLNWIAALRDFDITNVSKPSNNESSSIIPRPLKHSG